MELWIDKFAIDIKEIVMRRKELANEREQLKNSIRF